MNFTRIPSSSPSVRHVSAPAVQSRHSGEPRSQSARWETSLGPPFQKACFCGLNFSSPRGRQKLPLRPARRFVFRSMPKASRQGPRHRVSASLGRRDTDRRAYRLARTAPVQILHLGAHGSNAVFADPNAWRCLRRREDREGRRKAPRSGRRTRPCYG
jgi:hypothetical protein